MKQVRDVVLFCMITFVSFEGKSFEFIAAQIVSFLEVFYPEVVHTGLRREKFSIHCSTNAVVSVSLFILVHTGILFDF